MVGWYNGFSPKTRMRGDKILKKAVSDGVLPPLDSVKCAWCGQDKGIRHYHNEDYSPENIIQDATPLCWRCHLMLHSRWRYPKSYKFYKKLVDNGQTFPPVYDGNIKHLDLNILECEKK